MKTNLVRRPPESIIAYQSSIPLASSNIIDVDARPKAQGPVDNVVGGIQSTLKYGTSLRAPFFAT